MGSAMAGHLAKGGHTLALYDIAPTAATKVARRHKGARAVRTPREVAEPPRWCSPCSRRDGGARVRTRPDGLAAGLSPAAVLLDTSSAEPWITRETAARLAEQGVTMIDGPSPAPRGCPERHARVHVRRRSGGAQAGAPAACPHGQARLHLGPVGSGHAMKTVNNLATALTVSAPPKPC